MRSSRVQEAMQAIGEDISLVTVKRMLAAMVKMQLLSVSGDGPSTTYDIATMGRLVADVDAKQYCLNDPDDRYGSTGFNFHLLHEMPEELFTDTELQALECSTREYEKRTENVPAIIAKKEMERLVIELSWKSSKIEGNTYTLLDTEKLILEHTEARGHDKSEARMILNHKDAFTLIHTHAKDFRTLTKANVEHVHSAIIKGLGVARGLRKAPVGVTGSLYQPLDNVHQISDAMQALVKAVGRIESPYAKALLALLGISYIQPFEDGNKRTARLMANALLLAHGCAPLSYRSVNEDAYREATLVFYELNSIVPFKQIFLAQYDFAARNYVVR
jgi:fido (protein-threonine AMPylation protein)